MNSKNQKNQVVTEVELMFYVIILGLAMVATAIITGWLLYQIMAVVWLTMAIVVLVAARKGW